MSETVMYSGKMRQLKEETTFEEMLKSKSVELNTDYYDKAEEQVKEDMSDMFVEHDGKWFEVISCNHKDNEQDIFEASINDDGDIDFLVQFYNGGCGLGEALEESISRM